MIDMKKKPLGVSVSPEIYDAIKQYAKATKRTKSSIVESAIEDGMVHDSALTAMILVEMIKEVNETHALKKEKDMLMGRIKELMNIRRK